MSSVLRQWLRPRNSENAAQGGARWQRVRRPALLARVQGTAPLSDHWGTDRGTPVDRYYIEKFLQAQRDDIYGHVLEMQDRVYTQRFGSHLTHSDVLDIDANNPRATIVADLMRADAISDNTIDCMILTQTLQYLYDLHAALGHIHRFLKPGGVLLVTAPSISRVDIALRDVDYWRFTLASCEKLFGECFGQENITVRAYGNVLTAMAFLTGMALEELKQQELDLYDERFPVIVSVRAVKRKF
jgi:hypothetical protein